MFSARRSSGHQLTLSRGWAITIVVLIGLVTLAPAAFGAGIRAIEALTGHDDTTLGEGLAETRAFIDATVNQVADGLPVSEAPDSADPALASELRNNHSFDDHSRPQYAGYNDCDSWKNIILDGWTAMYRVEMTLRDDQDAERLLADTRQFWESRGYEVQSTKLSSGRLNSSSLFIPGYALHVDALQREATVIGWTDCLPPA